MPFRSTAQPGTQSETPPSSAWLAAQQAFSAHQPATAAEPVIIVRRARAFSADTADKAAGATPPSTVASKTARIFRITPSRADAAEPDLQAARQMSSELPRKARIAIDKRPGPVLRIVHQLPTAMAEPEAPMPNGGMATLRAMMAEIDAIFSDIQAAQDLRFLD
jgi:hypothetical protein